jgi:hypothetical protein
MQRKLLRVIGDGGSFEGFAGLCLEVVDVIDAHRAEPVPIRSRNKVAAERTAGSEHCLRSGAKAGIALIAKPGLCETGELIGLQLLVDEFEQVFDLLAKLGRDVRHSQRRLQIAARLGIGAELIVQHAELKACRPEPGIVEPELC